MTALVGKGGSLIDLQWEKTENGVYEPLLIELPQDDRLKIYNAVNRIVHGLTKDVHAVIAKAAKLRNDNEEKYKKLIRSGDCVAFYIRDLNKDLYYYWDVKELRSVQNKYVIKDVDVYMFTGRCEKLDFLFS